MMERIAFAAEILPGKELETRRLLGIRWPEITALLEAEKVRNFSIWMAADKLFFYGEREEAVEGVPAAVEALSKEAESVLRWLKRPGEKMRLMYENFGVVRQDKSCIRHRVFMTRLKDGCIEEYRRRHAALEEARTGIDPGPDSNFSIWSDGRYIFGYNEIDTTMETPETPESHAATVAWESRQLEIMDWITDDCDWLTGERNARCIRLAWRP